MGTTIHAGPSGRMSLEEHEELRATVEAADADARDNWGDPQWMREMLADLTTEVWTGFQHENFVEMMATVETAGEFEDIFVEYATGLEVFWVAQGGQIDESTIDEHLWPMKRNFVGYHVHENEDRIRSGFSRWVNRLIPMATAQMDAAINSRLLRVYRASMLPGSDSYLEGNGIPLSMINNAISEVWDEASGDPTTPADGFAVSIVGRGPIVDSLMNQLVANDNFAGATQEEITRTGRLGTYRGTNLMKLRNWKDRHARSFFPGNELMVTSTAAAKVGFWGGIKSKEWTEEGGEEWHNWGRRQAGFAVHHPEYARRIVDLDRQP